MRSEHWNQIKIAITAALGLEGAERQAMLDRVCAGNHELRREVEELLAIQESQQLGTGNKDRNTAHIHSNAGLKRSSPDANADCSPDMKSTVTATPISERAGARIGPYKLLQQIGEGGFGTVFMAEQEQPLRRRVALKIIKMGMDTRTVIARFEAERQALAIMDHPNIARVLHAGATESGRPYFVMELVKGDPITKFCDESRLTIRERLELFVQVCNALQHAHQKGVIHRDIKPGNVLVCRQDGKPHVRVIDFGIAKATDHRLTEKTLFTEFHQMIGTPAYMSPEQAGGSPDIDTRTDVYSLGVLLYELLIGATPFDAERLRSAAFAELQRIIKEEEPPAPSIRLSRSAKTLAATAAARHIDPGKLGPLVKGELDWIVLKAMEKDRTRRYESPNQLASDIQRHLAEEPIQAAPPSSWYLFRKFARRHKRPVAIASAAAILLALSTVIVGYFATQLRTKNKELTEYSEVMKDALEKIANRDLSHLKEAAEPLSVGASQLDDAAKLRAIVAIAVNALETGSQLAQDQSNLEENIRTLSSQLGYGATGYALNVPYGDGGNEEIGAIVTSINELNEQIEELKERLSSQEEAVDEAISTVNSQVGYSGLDVSAYAAGGGYADSGVSSIADVTVSVIEKASELKEALSNLQTALSDAIASVNSEVGQSGIDIDVPSIGYLGDGSEAAVNSLGELALALIRQNQELKEQLANCSESANSEP